jgi:hypothetical protein
MIASARNHSILVEGKHFSSKREVMMDEQSENEGTAHYRYSSGTNYGVQIIR